MTGGVPNHSGMYQLPDRKVWIGNATQDDLKEIALDLLYRCAKLQIDTEYLAEAVHLQMPPQHWDRAHWENPRQAIEDMKAKLAARKNA